jgi:hypothetical protein
LLEANALKLILELTDPHQCATQLLKSVPRRLAKFIFPVG